MSDWPSKDHHDFEGVIEISSEDGASGDLVLPDLQPAASFLVEVEVRDERTLTFSIEAFDAVAAVSKVATLMSRADTGRPIPIAAMKARTEDGTEIEPVCVECRKQGPSVRSRLAELDDLFCRDCWSQIVDELGLEQRVGSDGRLEYRLPPGGGELPGR